MKVIVVCGPPLSGKTTYVQERLTDKDLVYDYDAIMNAVTNFDYQMHDASFKEIVHSIRDSMIDQSIDIPSGTLYIVTTFISKPLQSKLSNLNIHFEKVELKVDKQICLARLNTSSRKHKAELAEVIHDWYRRKNRGGAKTYDERDEETTVFYNTKEWRKKREEIRRRDNYECQLCKKEGLVTIDVGEKNRNGRKKNALIVHHIKELKDFPDLALNDDNLITVCFKHHEQIHERWRDNFNNEPKENKWTSDEKW